MKSPERETTLSVMQTENLIVAILIGDSTVICKNSGLHELDFTLPTNRQHILKQYLSNNPYAQIEIVQVNEQTNTYKIKSNFMLERIIRKWVDDRGKVIAVNPLQLSSSVFMLWVCLFANRTKFEGTIKSRNISLEATRVICKMYAHYLESSYILYKNGCYTIGALNGVFLYSIRNNRPSYETLEIGALLDEEYSLNQLRQLVEGEMEFA